MPHPKFKTNTSNKAPKKKMKIVPKKFRIILPKDIKVLVRKMEIKGQFQLYLKDQIKIKIVVVLTQEILLINKYYPRYKIKTSVKINS